MTKIHVPQIVGPNGQPLPPSNGGEMGKMMELLNSINTAKRSALQNSLEGLVSGLSSGMRPDNITSFNPLFQSSIYAPLTVNYTLLSYLYKTHGVLQTMIDEPVLDAFRDGLELSSKELGEESLSELMDFAEETGAWEALKSMLMWGRLYGGAGLVVNAGQDPSQPLDETKIKKGNLEFYDADRWEFSGAYRSAATFMFYGQKLDATRVLTYSGKRAPRILRVQLGGWGLSEFERVVEDFNAWLRGRNVLYEILDEAKVDVYQIKDYASTLAIPGGQATIQARIQATNSIKNFMNALILDSEDEYKVLTNSFPGLADIMRENRIGIACATRMPFSKLFGTTAQGGLGNSGEDDLENYNAMITSQVRAPSRPIIRKMLRLMQFAVFGREFDIDFEWKPLRVLSARDQADIDDKTQMRFERLYASRILDSKELGELLHKHKLISIQTKAQKGLLPMNPEVPTKEDMFADKDEDGDDDNAEKDKGDNADGKDADA